MGPTRHGAGTKPARPVVSEHLPIWTHRLIDHRLAAVPNPKPSLSRRPALILPVQGSIWSMATTVKPVDCAEGYLRWKESLLLRLHSLNVAHALSEDCPAAGDQGARKWARDDAVCRGHILATLSDRIFPDYAHHATARALWQAVARTYELETRSISWRNLKDFEYDEGAPLLEQLAHLEALGVGAKYSDDLVAGLICEKLPEEVATPAVARSDNGIVSMSLLWDVARRMAAFWIDCDDERRRDEKAAMAEDQAGFADVL